MKKLFLGLVFLIPVLSGCFILVDVPYQVTIVGTPVFGTNHEDSKGNPVICDDKVTTLIYSFRFQGNLTKWRSYLEGATEGILDQSDVTLTFNSTGVIYDPVNKKVDVSYSIAPGAAPRVIAPDKLEPSITIEDIGLLVLIIQEAGKRYTADLPVKDSCTALGID
jgi:hypothetical protein